MENNEKEKAKNVTGKKRYYSKNFKNKTARDIPLKIGKRIKEEKKDFSINDQKASVTLSGSPIINESRSMIGRNVYNPNNPNPNNSFNHIAIDPPLYAHDVRGQPAKKTNDDPFGLRGVEEKDGWETVKTHSREFKDEMASFFKTHGQKQETFFNRLKRKIKEFLVGSDE